MIVFSIYAEQNIIQMEFFIDLLALTDFLLYVKKWYEIGVSCLCLYFKSVKKVESAHESFFKLQQKTRDMVNIDWACISQTKEIFYQSTNLHINWPAHQVYQQATKKAQYILITVLKKTLQIIWSFVAFSSNSHFKHVLAKNKAKIDFPCKNFVNKLEIFGMKME